MDSLYEAAESITPLSSVPASVPNWMVTTDDQRFLLLFIMGTYFGPDLKAEKPKKSALQRIAEDLPPYTSDQLAGSQMKTVEAERVYYYVLRKADQSVIVKLPLLHQFFQCTLFSPPDDSVVDHRQFPDLFPMQLHPQSRFRNRYKIIENIVFINNPEISYIKPEDVERFKRLTRLEDLLLDRDAARLYSGVGICGLADNAEEELSDGKRHAKPLRRSRKKRRVNDCMEAEAREPLAHIHAEPVNAIPCSSVPYCSSVPSPAEAEGSPVERVGPAMIFLPSHPTVEEWSNIVKAAKNGIALTGSVAERQAGPLIGLVDVGVCEDAYLFRISLPGVRKDEREFSCEVETDGRVHIKGVTTTGQRLIFKKSQVFEMQTQYLCQPGQFSVSFQLPGPVEPREFSGNFGSDGILEGVVMKERVRLH
ncbi:increased DNA methylation 2-like [Magnolia sinica]|uniref:increased DNA methylation 2-like n=1 Tax=Magnolia sinica TaxID=86752 RepID=UPI00265A6ADF|nr:increased DNA methylation 2-like [Magnolia sinica]XP_058077740.1 increased DNA methylation 2-like [Magnolia sinica]XP_058077741.1 increased DNA methylation 2-like [Magnolia sinica]XP_058077742.1 increased DNA methylation 2-like [Magnolia sinica]